MPENNVKISSPWAQFQKMVQTIFAQDPDIKVQKEDLEEGAIKSFWIESQNSERLAALQSLMKEEIDMGNITIKMDFRYANGAYDGSFDPNDIETWKIAFKCCPYFVTTYTVAPSIVSPGFSYAVFSRNLVSFFNDNLADYCQNTHMIAADAVREMTIECNVMLCTKAPDAPGGGGKK